MSDVFLSYAREDRSRLEGLVRCIESAGLSVFWDREIPPGMTWREVLDSELRAARCVLVIWSEHSVQSQWVLEEAEDAKARGRLIPALIDAISPPIGFRTVQAADLTNWDGSEQHEDLELLLGAIRHTVTASAGAAKSVAEARESQRPSRMAAWLGSRLVRSGATTALSAALAFSFFGEEPALAPAPPRWLIDEFIPLVHEMVRLTADLATGSGHYLHWEPSSQEVLATQLTDLRSAIHSYNETCAALKDKRDLFRSRIADLHVADPDLEYQVFKLFEYSDEECEEYDPPELDATQSIADQHEAMLTSWREYETKIEGPLNQLRDQLHALEHVVFLRANTELPGCLE